MAGAKAKPVLLIGASSQVGYFVRQRLAALGQPILALSRRPQPGGNGCDWLQAELPLAMPTLPALAAIISAGPLDGLGRWLATVPDIDCPRVIATSSMSAVSKQTSPVPAERALAQQLCAAEQQLAEVCGAQQRAWTILRPTLIYGAGLDRSLSPIARKAQRYKVFPLPEGRGLRQPVHADDVAAALCAATQSETARQQLIACGGGERLSAAEMFARVHASLRGPCLGLRVPRPFLACAARLWPTRAGMLARLEHDLIADNQALEQLLGIYPRGFQPCAEAWWPVSAAADARS